MRISDWSSDVCSSDLGGIAAVLEPGDTFESHIDDTMTAGAGLNNRDAVEFVVENAPAVLERLADLGVPFNPGEAGGERRPLTLEGGHRHRRDVHVADSTGPASPTARDADSPPRPKLRPAPATVYT